MREYETADNAKAPSSALPPLSLLLMSKQARMADSAKALLSVQLPSLLSREQVRDGQQCQGFVIHTAAATTVVV
jgi:hypothetical protein